MSAVERNIKIVRPIREDDEEESRIKAEINSHMPILRHYGKFGSRVTGEHLLREVMSIAHELSRRFGMEIETHSSAKRRAGG